MKKAQSVKGYLAFQRIAQYWWTTRFEGSAEGASVLRRSIKEFPGALIFLTYLGEHLNITRDYAEALETWNQYLDLLEESPYAMAQKGYSLARLKKLDESIEITRRAVNLDTASMDLKLELASRLVDAKKLGPAEAILAPLENNKYVYGEVLLRLGYIYLLQKSDDRAEQLFRRTLTIATTPSEWRTRGRTRYDLAIVMARKGRLAAAERHLLDAANEGFMVQELLKTNADLHVLADRPKVAHLFKNFQIKRKKPILMVSPFPVDYSGKIVPDAKRPPTMTGVSF